MTAEEYDYWSDPYNREVYCSGCDVYIDVDGGCRHAQTHDDEVLFPEGSERYWFDDESEAA